ncbi:MAG: glycosyltransferase family 2 protein [Coprococcus sp.]|nr:glycosyltransferase family 2 protein [Coprococcus sp.]
MISIILAIYNSNYKKIQFTLDSIISQSYSDYEIIIADDCSEEDPTHLIEEFMKEKNFSRYKIVRGEENRGTVRNLLNALAYANGEFVKTFGAGDGFFRTDSLYKMAQFISKNECEFSYAQTEMFYRMPEGKIHVEPFTFPFAVKDLFNRKFIGRDFLLYKDNVSGISMWYRKDLFREYLERAKDSVKYVEDICQLEYLIDGHRISCFKECLFLYEGYSGISTSGSDSFSKLIHEDEKRYYRYLIEKYPDNKWLRKRLRLKKVIDIKNVRLRAVCVMIFSPLEIRIFIQRYWAKYVSKMYGKAEASSYLDKIVEMYKDD